MPDFVPWEEIGNERFISVGCQECLCCLCTQSSLSGDLGPWKGISGDTQLSFQGSYVGAEDLKADTCPRQSVYTLSHSLSPLHPSLLPFSLNLEAGSHLSQPDLLGLQAWANATDLGSAGDTTQGEYLMN